MANTVQAVHTSSKPNSGTQPRPSRKALCMAAIRFFFGLSISLSLSWIFDDQKLGGFACIAMFMALLSDDKSTLPSRLGGLFVTFVFVMLAAGLGLLVKDMPEGKWVVLACCTFGAGLLPLVDNFWWLTGKYALIFLLISLFDFSPTLSAVIGYTVGFGLAAIVITFDHFVWKADNLGARPMAQLKDFIGGNKNPYYFALISALITVLSLWTASFFDFMEPAWVGISVVYLINMHVHAGFKRSLQRIVGTLLGYLIVMFLFPLGQYPIVLAMLIVLSGITIPIFLPLNYTLACVSITAFILFALDWLLAAYGGDHNILAWRFFDTLYGVLWAVIGLLMLKVAIKFDKHPPKGV